MGRVVEVAGAVLAVPASLHGMSVLSRARLQHPVLVQVVRYAIVGGLGTVVNAVLFLMLRDWWDTMPANLVALVLSTAVSTEVNRRFTFGGVEVHHRWRSYVQSGGTVLFYAFYSSAVLLLLDQVIDNPTAWEETLAVAAASILGGLGRFLVLRYWVFEPEVSAHIAPRRPTFGA